MGCVRTPARDGPGRRVELRTFPTFTGAATSTSHGRAGLGRGAAVIDGSPELDEAVDDHGDEHRGQNHNGERRETVSVRSLSGRAFRLSVHLAGPILSLLTH